MERHGSTARYHSIRGVQAGEEKNIDGDHNTKITVRYISDRLLNIQTRNETENITYRAPSEYVGKLDTSAEVLYTED